MSVWPVYLTTGEDRPAESSSLAAIDPPGRKGSPEPGILILRLVPSRPRSVANAVRLSSPLHWNPTQSVWLPIKQSDSLAAVMVGLATDPGEITTERNRLGVRSLSGVGGLVEDIVSGKNHIEEPGLVARTLSSRLGIKVDCFHDRLASSASHRQGGARHIATLAPPQAD